jgi:E1A/CREB-binding protein
MYCTNCNIRIKPKATYYFVQAVTQSGDTKQCFCTNCYSGFGQTVEIDGNRFLKSHLAKRKNEEDLEEPWVQCDACETWVHQICTLFNGRRNEGGESPFTCPSCILEQMSRSERTSASPAARQDGAAGGRCAEAGLLQDAECRGAIAAEVGAVGCGCVGQVSESRPAAV